VFASCSKPFMSNGLLRVDRAGRCVNLAPTVFFAGFSCPRKTTRLRPQRRSALSGFAAFSSFNLTSASTPDVSSYCSRDAKQTEIEVSVCGMR
jgi:hypothetical protein